MADRNYPVGFRRPPQHSRFKPGQSGNPRGRPKGAKNLATVLDEELNARVPITENGRRKRVPKVVVIAKNLVNTAAQGNLKAMSVLFNQLRPANAEGSRLVADDPLSREEDRLVMESIRQRLLRAAANDAPPLSEEAAASGQDDDSEAS